ncbi:MAG: DUF167 domain-containing protein [Candidatus Hodarchaeales archaeon]
MGNVIINVRVKPGSKRDTLVMVDDNGISLLIEVKAPAIKGKANSAVVKLLRKRLKKRVEIIKGLKSSEKVLEIEDMTMKELRERLQIMLPNP